MNQDDRVYGPYFSPALSEAISAAHGFEESLAELRALHEDDYLIEQLAKIGVDVTDDLRSSFDRWAQQLPISYRDAVDRFALLMLRARGDAFAPPSARKSAGVLEIQGPTRAERRADASDARRRRKRYRGKRR